MPYKIYSSLLMIFLFSISNTFGAGKPHLIVGYTTDSEPVSYIKNHEPHGFGISIFKEIARKNYWQVKYVQVKNTAEGLKLMQNHEISALVGPYSMQRKINANFEYSSPFYVDRLGAYVKTGEVTLKLFLNEMFSPILLWILLITVIFYIILAYSLWFFEIDNNPELKNKSFRRDFPTFAWKVSVSYLRDFVYFRVPYTRAGKISTAFILMSSFFFSVTMHANITASIINIKNFGKNNFNHKSELIGLNMGVVKTNRFAIDEVKLLGAESVYPSIEKLFEALSKDEIDVAITTRSLGDAFLFKKPNLKLKAASLLLASELWAFVTPKNFGQIYTGSNLRNKINQSLLQMQQNNEIQSICKKFFHDSELKCL